MGVRLVLGTGLPCPAQHFGLELAAVQLDAVECLVHVRERGRQTTVASQLLDPANRPAHRQWVRLEADLSRYARPGAR